MKVYILLEMIDLGDHVIAVYGDKYAADKRKEELNNKYKEEFPKQSRNSPYIVEEYEVLGDFCDN